MPELPEVETIRQGLEAALVGEQLTNIIQRRANLRFDFPKNFVEKLCGRTVLHVKRRAKYLLIYFDNQDVLISHLGMSGSFRIFTNGQSNSNQHDHVTFITKRRTLIHYNDPRRFGFMDITNTSDLADYPMLSSLGPEPLSNAFTARTMIKNLTNLSGPIKPILLNQRVVAGLGNIYACEALYQAKLSPRRRAASIRGKRAENLVAAIKSILNKAIAAGGSTLRNYQHTDGKLGYFQNAHAVYGRFGELCPGCTCTKGIKKIIQSGRSTFFCSKYQI